MLKLPLWFVTEKGKKGWKASPPQDSLAFSSFDRFMAFMAHSHAGAWDVVEATDRESLIAVIANAHIRGSNAVYVDPEIGGDGGKCVFLTDVILIE
jgi:hypothetical protein